LAVCFVGCFFPCGGLLGVVCFEDFAVGEFQCEGEAALADYFF
jgi:hypothetical protein